MPLFEYECDKCYDKYNSDIDALVPKLNKTNAAKIMKQNPGFLYIEVTDAETGKEIFALGEKATNRGPRRFRFTIKNKVLYIELKNFRFSHLIYEEGDEKDLECPICGELVADDDIGGWPRRQTTIEVDDLE